MDKNLVAAIAEKNLSHIKSALTSINLKDPNFSTGEFEEALRYVSEQGINLYEPFDGEKFKPERLLRVRAVQEAVRSLSQ